jgi:hypothetical protein
MVHVGMSSNKKKCRKKKKKAKRSLVEDLHINHRFQEHDHQDGDGGDNSDKMPICLVWTMAMVWFLSTFEVSN